MRAKNSKAVKLPKAKKTPDKPIDSDDKIKRLTINIPASLHTRLKIASVMIDQTMNDMVSLSIENYLKEIKQ